MWTCRFYGLAKRLREHAEELRNFQGLDSHEGDLASLNELINWWVPLLVP